MSLPGVEHPELDSVEEDALKHKGKKDYALWSVCFFNLVGDSVRKPGVLASGN